MAQPIDMSAVEGALNQFTIPPQPQVLTQLQEELKACEPSINVISNLVEQDIAISRFVLKVINSPLFALKKEIESVGQACRILGLGKVVKLINSMALRCSLEKNADEFTGLLWSTSSEIANACMALGQYLDIDLADDAYTVGMFHNAGMALIYQQQANYREVMGQAYRQNSTSISEYEEASFESSHELLSFLIAQHWGLSNSVCNVIAYHHSGSIMLNTGAFDEKQLFSVLKLAEHMIGLPTRLGEASFDHEWTSNGPQVLDVLDLEEFQLQDLGDMLYGFGVRNIYNAG